ncbi:glycoside hydrolase family 5 protein [Xylariaceae sp. FL0662B]|nr:glycoside hydrolase family 5 protein [Xylariaceae sp. FL0662B]
MYFIRPLLLPGLASTVVLAKVQYLGVALAGGDFGCGIDGSCPTSLVQLPLDNGVAQMQHFVQADGINMIRLPISWQFLVNNQLGGDIDEFSLAEYDQLMQACLATGAHCIIDIHNFARWNGGIIGQGGPTDDQFVSLWSQLATKYAGDERVVFELMNEPHDLDISTWAQTCQKAVTAIRQGGAAAQMILLPGTNFDSAAALVESGSAAALLDIANPDGSTDNLILDIHKYLDEDNSGTHAECITDNVDAFTSVAKFLRDRNRKGLISETGASSDGSCFTAFCAQNTFINENPDVFVGLVAWAAGSFDTSYILALTPSEQKGGLVDTKLMLQCVLSPWNNSKAVSSAPLDPSSTPSPLTTLRTATGTPSPSTPSATAALSSTAAVHAPKSTVTIIPTTAHLLSTASTVPTTLLTAAGAPFSESEIEYIFAKPSTSSSSMQTSIAADAASPPTAAPVAATRIVLWGFAMLVWVLDL